MGTSTFGRCKPILNDTGVYLIGRVAKPVAGADDTVAGRKEGCVSPTQGYEGEPGFRQRSGRTRQLPAVIDRRYPLDKIAEAFEYVATGNKVGNVIITLDS